MRAVGLALLLAASLRGGEATGKVVLGDREAEEALVNLDDADLVELIGFPSPWTTPAAAQESSWPQLTKTATTSLN